jgi:hypothetical protein
MTLEEFMQQQATQRGYTKSPLRYVYEGFDGGQEEIDQNRVDFQQLLPILKKIDPMYGEMEDYQVGEADAPSYAQRFASREEELKNAYYADPSNFIETRATPYNQGINTFNEGNADQKRILDQINTGQLRIVPVTYTSDFLNSDAGAIQKQTHSGYELKDAKTGQKIQDVTPVDAGKGIFNIVADDKNSSGFFNNYVSTDPSGFVNPVVSEQQSQYQSRPNSSANFYKNAALAALSMSGLAFPGLGQALGAATGLGNVGGNIALNTGINAIKQGLTGQFNPLALATSAGLSYLGSGANGGGGTDVFTAEDLELGQAMTDLASSSDATRLADLVRAFENPTELTGPTIDTASNVSIENPSVIDSQAPFMPSNLQDTAYLDPNLIDVAPDNVTIGTPEPTGTYQMGQGTSLSQDAMTNRLNPFYGTANPELSANYNTVSNLVGGGAESNLSALDQLSSNSLIPLGGGGIGGTELGSVGSILGSGKGLGQQTLAQVLAPTGLSGLTVQDLESDKPMYETTETTPLTKPKLLSNILKSSLPQSLKTAQASQQQSNLANILRGTQMPQTALPSIYKQANPFNFGQQNQPVQDTTALANLLRTA